MISQICISEGRREHTIHVLKNDQHRATQLLSPLQDKSYSERFSTLALPSLSHRHLRGDLIFQYKILDSDFGELHTPVYSSTSK